MGGAEDDAERSRADGGKSHEANEGNGRPRLHLRSADRSSSGADGWSQKSSISLVAATTFPMSMPTGLASTVLLAVAWSFSIATATSYQRRKTSAEKPNCFASRSTQPVVRSVVWPFVNSNVAAITSRSSARWIEVRASMLGTSGGCHVKRLAHRVTETRLSDRTQTARAILRAARDLSDFRMAR
jgi:hypothetical protein